MKKLLSITVLFICILFCEKEVKAQLTVTSSHTATQLVQKLLGTGITVSNETLTCDSTKQSGIFTVTTSNLGLDSGIILTSGSCINGPLITGVSGPATQNVSNTTTANYTDADLAALIGTTTANIKDACKLEFDFIPTGDTVKFRYVFGSDEYPTFNCSNYNDVFGFFISGPGITGTQNIALVPGTNIPVAINSVNDGTNLGPLCTSMGTGSPFTTLYVNNATGTTVAYNGFTQIFTAYAVTLPCSTYHIKLAISDKNDQVLDSGVFLEAGSLNSNGVVVNNTTASISSPVDYIIEGCMPVNIKLNVPVPKPYPINLNLVWSGTATNGVDYPMQPTSKVLSPNTTLDSIYFNTFADGIPEGLETLTLQIYNTSSCNTSLLDSVTYYISDSIILDYSPLVDTICPGDTTMLVAGSDSTVNISWSPSTSLTNANGDTTFAFPTVSTVYSLLATYAGCPLENIQIPITVLNYLTVDAGLDDTICVGAPINLNAVAGPPGINFSYEWTPAAQLSSPNTAFTTFTPLTLGTYSLEVTATTDSGCFVKDTIDILAIENSFILHNNDTAICDGGSVQVDITGSPYWDYKWTPTTYFNDTTLLEPLITPDSIIQYFITGTYPGCLPVTKAFKIDVQPNPIVKLGVDRTMCEYDTVMIQSDVEPSWYPQYTYDWQPNNAFYNSSLPHVVFKSFQNTTNVNLVVTTPAGCVGSDDIVVTVNEGNFLNRSIIDTSYCAPASFHLGLSGADTYVWSPSTYLSDPNIADPRISPANGINYVVVGTSLEGCNDTAYVSLIPNPGAVLELGESIEIFDGEEQYLYTEGNCSYFQWSPGMYLDDPNSSSPLLSNVRSDVSYVVTGRTPLGCESKDTLKILYNDGIIIELPNAFLPSNGPVSIIKKGNWTLDKYQIFDRWGVLVFETSDVMEGWDGTYKNTPQPIGTYVYIIQAHKANGEKLNKTGNILLIK